MSRKRKRLKDGLPGWTHTPVSIGLRTVMTAGQLFGLESSLEQMDRMGRGFSKLPFNRKQLDRCKDRIRFAFPDWDEDRVAHVAQGVWGHLFQLGAEMLYTPRLISTDSWHRHASFGQASEAFAEVLANRPVILITGHFGNWEMMGYTMGVVGVPVHAVYRPLDLKPLDRWVRQVREKRGMMMVDKFGAVRELPRAMQRGGMPAFVADQNAGDRGLFVPFFGRLTSTYKSVGMLAMQTGACIICGGGVRSPRRGPDGVDVLHDHATGRWQDAMGYRFDIHDVIRPEDWQDAPDPLFYITARYRRSIENMVRTAPEQYFWMHRVWKSRPRHERLRKEFPDNLKRKMLELPWMDEAEVERIVEQSERDIATLDRIGGDRLE